jgi:hypothetical protein
LPFVDTGQVSVNQWKKHNQYFLLFSAFSFFSAFEYVIAYSNMGYHVSAYLEFKHKSLIAADVIAISVLKNGDAPDNSDNESITQDIDGITRDSDDDSGIRRSVRIRKKGAGASVQ